MQTMTLSYEGPPGASREITIRVPDFGNSDTPDPNQEQFPTVGGRTFVYDRGPEVRKFSWQFRDRLPQEKADVERFFSASSVNWGRRWFTVTLSIPWLEVLRCGALIDGETIKCGDYVCGEKVAQDEISFRVQLRSVPINFVQTLDECWDYEMSLEVVVEPAPTNT